MEKIVHKTISLKRLMFHIMLPILGGVLLRFILNDTQMIYQSLNLPFFAAPTWVFKPLWTLAFVFVGISAYLVSDSIKDSKLKIIALRLYYATLAVTLLWPIIFFNMQSINMSLAVSLLLLACGGATFIKFRHFSVSSVICFSIYAVWVIYLVVLNAAVVMMN